MRTLQLFKFGMHFPLLDIPHLTPPRSDFEVPRLAHYLLRHTFRIQLEVTSVFSRSTAVDSPRLKPCESSPVDVLSSIYMRKRAESTSLLCMRHPSGGSRTRARDARMAVNHAAMACFGVMFDSRTHAVAELLLFLCLPSLRRAGSGFARVWRPRTVDSVRSCHSSDKQLVTALLFQSSPSAGPRRSTKLAASSSSACSRWHELSGKWPYAPQPTVSAVVGIVVLPDGVVKPDPN